MSDNPVTSAGGPLYPIREVSRLTGVNSVTLRAWERRYGLIQPRRTPKGHRLYARDDIERVERIVQWLNRGVPVSQVGDLLDGDGVQEELEPTPPVTPATDNPVGIDWHDQVTDACALIERFDEKGLDQLYTHLFGRYPTLTVLENVWKPVADHVSQQDDDDVSRLFLESFLRTRLALRLYYSNLDVTTPRLLLARLPEEKDSLHLLLAATHLGASGFHVSLIDNATTDNVLIGLTQRCRADVVILTGGEQQPADMVDRLKELTAAMHVPVCLSGPVTRLHRKALSFGGLTLLDDNPGHGARTVRQLVD
ncbi:MerR family transcriptional regulator [Larsenimonas rhizosphaerae]|uniref:MerR family transcriptional regulator n=1 Tax=Larsenimonas rhizosphaerae TaxID=2944682 RepID=UPI0020339180|nr:MerR family transcriptional regulator [Larsenimonas rhizosphaerae]MCM2132177.1 MerR family transcriptional regulator [Larsenimonas rhizosphaerae]